MGRSRRKRLGQHFLTDRRVVGRIAGLLDGEPPRVVEIGPGRGALTRALAERFERVLALEMDEGLIPGLERWLKVENVEVRRQDALTAPFAELLEGEAPWQLAANLPYSVGTAILRRLFPLNGVITRMVVMLQLEVARRVVARPGQKAHGLLALERAAWADARLAFTVGPQAFRPRPRVMSAVLVIDLHPPRHDAGTLARALSLAARALTTPRKMLSNAVRPLVSPDDLLAAGLDPSSRPGEIDLDGWVRLARGRAAVELE
ncbi:MAG: ribosomal RNA small subunit methyltransferase A [Acidobacteria bacterium]|nr:ribosomal RNA small subunit methyltransferase A [Acidobacteriota bacterium]